MQQKTQHPVQFEITEQTRTVLEAWMRQARLRSEDFLFPTRLHSSDQLAGPDGWYGGSPEAMGAEPSRTIEPPSTIQRLFMVWSRITVQALGSTVFTMKPSATRGVG
jgi:hypothetical protein